jgi:transcriptional regulator with XRE-family HTH domain
LSGFFVFSGSNLRARRERKGVSREVLALTVGKSASAIGLYEAGFRSPPRPVLIRLAAALDCSPRDLVDEDPMFEAVAQ